MVSLDGVGGWVMAELDSRGHVIAGMTVCRACRMLMPPAWVTVSGSLTVAACHWPGHAVTS